MRLLAHALIAVGVGLIALAGLGVLRMPDLLGRLQAAGKATSLGLACVFAGVALLLSSAEAAIKLTLAVLFVFATAPVAAHAIGRVAYWVGVPLWEGTVIDELAGREEEVE